jgi:hypothetical protein
VPAAGAALIRFSATNNFIIPPVIVANKYGCSMKSAQPSPRNLYDTITLTNKGSSELPLWQIAAGLPNWLSVTVLKRTSSVQALVTKVNTAGLAAGNYHSIVKANNTEPVSGLPMSTVWYDVDLNVPNDVTGVIDCKNRLGEVPKGTVSSAAGGETRHLYDIAGRRIGDIQTLRHHEGILPVHRSGEGGLVIMK